MLGRFWGKGGSGGSKRLDPVDSRGLEVVDDDPQTAWSLWDTALAEQDSRYGALPPLPQPSPAPVAPMSLSRSPGKIETSNSAFNFDYDETPTRPMPMGELTNEQRVTQALDVVDQFHPRIATTIRTFWGHKECTAYINKLIMEGDDGMGNARSGFNAQAVQAMMELADLHDTIFGPMQ